MFGHFIADVSIGFHSFALSSPYFGQLCGLFLSSNFLSAHGTFVTFRSASRGLSDSRSSSFFIFSILIDHSILTFSFDLHEGF